MKLEEIKREFLNGDLSKNEYIDKMYNQHSLLFDYSNFIQNTNIEQIVINDNEVIATFRDSKVQFICIPGDKRLASLDTLNFSEYEKDELEMQFRLIQPENTIVDIGANLGWYSMHIAKKYLTATILAFEPVPRTFEFLNKNIQLNKLKNIKTYQIGLSDKTGKFDLYFDPLLSVNASLQNVAESSNIEKITCQINTLDEFCFSNNITRVDFIKCDVEGAELFSLKGARTLLIQSKPIVFCEMLRKWAKKFNYHPNDIINFMVELNYVCLVIRGKFLEVIQLINDETMDTNFIFLHTTKHKNLLSELIK